jgi:transcription elongation factor GreA
MEFRSIILESTSSAASFGLPMTRDAYRRLEAEIERLAEELRAARASALEVDNGPDAATPAVDGQFHLLSQRLDSLRRVLPQARVVDPDGAAVVGSQVTVRDVDGSLDSYALVAPGEADLRAGRISPESPLGAALLGRRAGEEIEVLAPAGPRRVAVIEVK